MDYKKIGENIKRIRKPIMSQKELGEKIGRTESSIRKYEKGLVEIPNSVLEDIAEALDVEIEDIIPEWFISNDEYEEAKKNIRLLQNKWRKLGITNLKEHEEKINSLLQNNLDRLNTMGKAKVVEYTDDLLTIDKYCKDKE